MATGIGAGRPPTRAATGYDSHGTKARPDAPRPDLATAEDFAEVRALLTSEEAKRVLDAVARQRGYFTRLDLDELRVWAEAEGNSIIYDRKVAELRDRGENIPIMITSRKIRIADGKEDPYGDTIQAYGVGGMAKRSAEEARLSRNALGMNKASRNRIVDEAVQGDLFADGVTGREGPPEHMTDEELDAALARAGANILPFVRTAAVAGE